MWTASLNRRTTDTASRALGEIRASFVDGRSGIIIRMRRATASAKIVEVKDVLEVDQLCVRDREEEEPEEVFVDRGTALRKSRTTHAQLFLVDVDALEQHRVR